MSDPSFNTPTYRRQQGSVFTIDSGGTLQVLAGGSIQNAGGQSSSGSQVFSGSVSVTGVIGAPAITLGGTLGKWAFGTLSLTSGVGTLGVPGFTRVLSANANAVLGEASGNGSATGVHIDLSLSGAGSVIFRALAGTLGYAANQVITYNCFGT
jgi:hypothetical protein